MSLRGFAGLSCSTPISCVVHDPSDTPSYSDFNLFATCAAARKLAQKYAFIRFHGHLLVLAESPHHSIHRRRGISGGGGGNGVPSTGGHTESLHLVNFDENLYLPSDRVDESAFDKTPCLVEANI